MKLYWSSTSNPHKVRMAVLELGLDIEQEFVDLFKGEARTPEFRAISPRGVVPVLHLDDGAILFESTAILSFLGHTTGRLFPSPGDEGAYAKALSLLHMEAAAFQTHAGTFFFNRHVMPAIGRAPDEARLDAARPKLNKLLQILADTLGEQPYLLGEFSLVDCAFAPYLPYLDLDGFPALVGWRDRLTGRPSFAAGLAR